MRAEISNSNIKLLALDLDGTLLDPSGKIPPANLEAIRAAEAAGVIVTIATGRRFRDARPVGLELELNGPMITHNGALLKYAETMETVAFSLIEHSTVEDIICVGKELGGDALVSTDPHGKGTLFYDRVSDDNIPLQKYLVWAEGLHGEYAERSVQHVERLEDVLDGHEVIHISFSGGCEPMAAMQAILERELGDSVTILATIYPRLDFTLLDILPPDASKGVGVEKLTSLNGLAAENVMAMGDNFNDLEMLEFAGTPVVMGNADSNLLERAEFYTTKGNNENGVAVAIERFILNV